MADVGADHLRAAAASQAKVGAGAPPGSGAAPSGKRKYRREKPWDTLPTADKWKIDSFSADDNKGGALLEESSFATLFPQYREQYLKTVWPDVKQTLGEHGVRAELDLAEGSITVRTTKKLWDPFIIIKARDLIKLLARSVPFPQAAKVLEDGMFCDIMKIKSYVRSKEKFVKRRQRLVGPNGSTLKAIELLTECYILVQGQTCCIMGSMKGIKQTRKIVEDCFQNIHPVYHIKELMIKRELEKDPALSEEQWDRFLPKFKKRNVQTKKLGKRSVVKGAKKKERSLFPPEQMPRKEDILMETGEYFLSDAQREGRKRVQREDEQKRKSAEKKKNPSGGVYPRRGEHAAQGRQKNPTGGGNRWWDRRRKKASGKTEEEGRGRGKDQENDDSVRVDDHTRGVPFFFFPFCKTRLEIRRLGVLRLVPETRACDMNEGASLS